MNDSVIPGGFRNPALPEIGRGLNRVFRDPALMTGIPAFLYMLNDFMDTEGYSPAERSVFSSPGHAIEGRINDIWNYTGNLVEQRGHYAHPDMIRAAQNAEIALRQYGVDYYRSTGERYQSGYSIEQNQPVADLFEEHRQAISAPQWNRADVRQRLDAYSEHWGISRDQLSAEQINEIMLSESPMDIAPEVNGEVIPPPPEAEAEAGTQPQPEDEGLTPEEIGLLMGLSLDTLRVTANETENRGRDCRLRRYSEGCPPPHTTPHHVVADRSFRHPASDETYPGGVPHADGYTICVSNGTPIFRGPMSNEHGRIHAMQNLGERILGARGTPRHTSTLGNLEWNGVIAAAAETGCDPIAMQRQLREYHQNEWGLGPNTRWRADPRGRARPSQVGSPPIQTPPESPY